MGIVSAAATDTDASHSMSKAANRIVLWAEFLTPGCDLLLSSNQELVFRSMKLSRSGQKLTPVFCPANWDKFKTFSVKLTTAVNELGEWAHSIPKLQATKICRHMRPAARKSWTFFSPDVRIPVSR
ncbi:hypothetical protein [Roseibium sp.]|uniref:hypothetical protein n=1 Tax=Roseibium sp. TaxID=1936156 RepID=UPI003A972CCA